MDVRDKRVLVGSDTSDDAGVYLVDDGFALVMTADVITPVSDDAFRFGQVAAANALSDVYAMGGTPLAALNLAFFPRDAIPVDVLRDILRGARDVVERAGAVTIGGHTVRDPEVKFGLAVTGTCDPSHFLPNSGARPGDALVLTKPLGTGLLIDAHRKGLVGEEVLEAPLDLMATLNDVSAAAALRHGARCATDVTGFGLAGHAWEVAQASGVGVRLFVDALPVFEAVFEVMALGASTGMTPENRESLGHSLRINAGVDKARVHLACDPQTSGGLLIGLASEAAGALVEDLRGRGVEAARIVGEVVEATSPHVELARGAGSGLIDAG